MVAGRPDDGDDGDDGPGEPDTAAVAEAAAPTLKVAAVARRLGVAPATLRTWARRYDLGPSAHTAGAHRQYSEQDLARLMVMRRMTLEGYSPAEAARVALQTPGPAAGDAAPTAATPSPAADDVLSPPVDTPDTPDTPAADASAPAPGHARVDGQQPAVPAQAPQRAREQAAQVPARPAGRRAEPLTPSVRSLARAAMARDAEQCERQLAAHLAVGGVLETWTTLVRPLLGALADRPRAVLPGHAPAHVLEGALLVALADLAESAAAPAGDVVLVARAPGDSDLLAHVVAGMVRDEGRPGFVLPGVHGAERVAAVAEHVEAAAVVVVADGPVGAPGVADVLRLAGSDGARLVLAGHGWPEDGLPAAGVTLVPELEEVLAAVRP